MSHLFKLLPSFYNYLTFFSLSTKIDMRKQISMCFLVWIKYILMKVKFDIDINNNELFKTIWKHKEFLFWKNSLIVIGSAHPHKAQIIG
jgi:hypothetical protein